MSATTMRVAGHGTTEVPGGIGLQGWVTVAWSAAGGIAIGGLLVALMTLSGRLSGMGLFMTSSGLFVIGALLGMAHGAALGYAGRPDGVTRASAARDVGMGAIYATVALPFAGVIAMWIALSMPALFIGRLPALIGVGAGWLTGTLIVAAAAVAGWRALRNAWLRWPERDVGTVLVAATFASLLVLFLMDRPEIWGLRLRVTETGAVLLALAGTFWVGLPIITLALRTLAGLPGRHPAPAFERSWRVSADLAVGLVAGIVVALIAAPFAVPAALPGLGATGAAGSIFASIGQALVDEVLLRLFLVTGAVWALLRWGRVQARPAAVMSVVAAAFVQVLLYAPGVASIGFPTALGTIGFTVMLVLVPALAFGTLYWTRGVGAAVTADATALVVLAAIV